jgi:hypothetical protein
MTSTAFEPNTMAEARTCELPLSCFGSGRRPVVAAHAQSHDVQNIASSTESHVTMGVEDNTTDLH